jgi:excisionase family DNA binding protein
MVQLSIPEAAVALGVSVDTIRRRIKAGLLRAQRDDHGAYLVEMHDVPGDDAATEPRPRRAEPPVETDRVPDSALPVASRSKATDRHLFKQEQRRASDFPQEIRGLRELLDVERKRNDELRDHLAFQRRQLEKAEAERERLVAILETQQQQFGIEQLQRILGDSPTRGRNER